MTGYIAAYIIVSWCIMPIIWMEITVERGWKSWSFGIGIAAWLTVTIGTVINAYSATVQP